MQSDVESFKPSISSADLMHVYSGAVFRADLLTTSWPLSSSLHDASAIHSTHSNAEQWNINAHLRLILWEMLWNELWPYKVRTSSQIHEIFMFQFISQWILITYIFRRQCLLNYFTSTYSYPVESNRICYGIYLLFSS